MSKNRVSQSLDKTNLRKRALREFLIGLVVAAFAGFISYSSYNAAATSRTGGTYTIYTGAIALGVVYAIKGGFTLLFPNLVLKWSKKSAKKSKTTTSDAKAPAEALVESDKKSEPEKIEF